ncbi:bet1-like SNARE 1-2 isoform X2 [Cornus florida]|uniref:bet1-like SNARE 1-2 isoform X2 n=1 Tax=Cornus florida TaxID=4283 RepID=UPI00289CADFE|nr:bet1-like SNARE 1-2 isoform X2 [Cornus florida]
MSYRREHRASRASLFDSLDGIEEGGLRASSSYYPLDDHGNDKAMDSLQDRVIFLKRLTGDIHEEVESHNRMLDRVVCWLQAMAWMHLGESCQELWIGSRWYLRRNQVGERVYLWHLL